MHLICHLLYYSIYRIEVAKDDSGNSIRAPQGSLPYLIVGGDRGEGRKEGDRGEGRKVIEEREGR
jgi:hypothetical protein